MTTYAISIVVTGQDKASGPLGGVSRALGGIGTVAGGILTAGALTAITRQIFNLGSEALDSYAKYERLGMALESLVAREMVNAGQAENLAAAMDLAGDKAKGLQEWIEKLAVLSPFNQEDIAQSFRLAMAYGFTSDEAKRLTTAMTDFAAGSGASGEVMNRIALALGQIKAKGKLAGQEMLQLTEAGLDVRGILAKAFNVTTEELVAMQEKGLIPADKAIEAIVKTLEEDFGGAAERQAGTFSGLIASLQDLKSIGLRKFFEGTFKSVQPHVQGFVDKFSDPTFMKNLSSMGDKLGAFVGDGLKFLGAFTGGMESLNNSPVMSSLGSNLKKVFDVITQPAIIGSANRTFNSIKNFLEDLSVKVIPWAVENFDKIGNWFTENGPLIASYVQVMSDAFNNILLPALMTLWNTAEPILSGLIDLVLGVAKFWMQIFTGDFSGALDTAKSIVVNAASAIWSAFKALLDGILGMFGTSLKKSIDVWKNNLNMLPVIGDKIWTTVKTKFTNALSGLVSGIQTGVQNMLNAFGNKVGEFADIGWNMIQSFQQGVEEAFASLLMTLGELIDLLPKVVKNALGIASPSKVFMALGRHMMEGLAIGVRRFANMPQVALDNVLNNFSGGRVSSLTRYVNNSTDQSQRYYAPVYVTVSASDPGIGNILRGLRTR